MRNCVIATAAMVLAAVPVLAQSPVDVTGPRTLGPLQVACTDLPVTAKPEPRLFIKGAHAADYRTLVATGAEVMINRLPDDGLAPGQRYVVRRLQGDARAFPREGQGYGAVRTAGFVTITAVDEFNARAVIDLACDGIVPGDYIEAYTPPPLPDRATAMVKPDFNDRANILPGTDARAIFGDGDTFSIDRGAAHGVVAGARFSIWRDHRDGVMPLVYLADAVVMEVGQQTSKVVIVKGVDAVSVGDVAIPRRQPN